LTHGTIFSFLHSDCKIVNGQYPGVYAAESARNSLQGDTFKV